MAGIVDIVNQLGTLAQAQSGDQNKGEEKKSRSKHVNSISRAALTALFVLMLLIGGAQLGLILHSNEYLRFKKLSIPPKLVTSFYVIIITSSWTTVASLIHLILKFTISKEKVSITALALFWSITILIAWIVTIIFFEIGLTHIPISDCPRRRKKWSFVCTELEVLRALSWIMIVISSLTSLVALARLVLVIWDWIKNKAKRGLKKTLGLLGQ